MSEEVICDHAEICTQRLVVFNTQGLVVCKHQKFHSVSDLSLNLSKKHLCTTVGYCSVAEINCKCIIK